MWALPVAWFSATGPPETAAGEAATTALQIMQLRTGSRTFCKCSALSCGAAALLLAGATEDSGCVAVWRMGRARDSGAGASSGAAGDPEALEGAAFEEVQLCTVKPSAAGYTTGMCMAVMLDDHPPVEGTSTERMWLWAMYESGDLFAFDVSDSRVGDAPADPKAALEPVMRIPMSKESGLVFVLSSTRAAAAAGSAEAAVAFAQLGDNKQSRVSVPRAGVGALALRADDRVLAAGCWDGTVRIFDFRKRRPLAVLTLHDDGAVQAVAWCDDADGTLLSGGKDGRIGVWQLYPPRRAARARG